MSTKNKFFISCDEAKIICDKSQYGEAGFWDIIKLKLRLSWCHITRAYSSNNAKLTELMDESKIQVLELNEKEEMQQKLQEKISKH